MKESNMMRQQAQSSSQLLRVAMCLGLDKTTSKINLHTWP